VVSTKKICGEKRPAGKKRAYEFPGNGYKKKPAQEKIQDSRRLQEREKGNIVAKKKSGMGSVTKGFKNIDGCGESSRLIEAGEVNW